MARPFHFYAMTEFIFDLNQFKVRAHNYRLMVFYEAGAVVASQPCISGAPLEKEAINGFHAHVVFAFSGGLTSNVRSETCRR
jgi:hypothetical protein